ncbi:unnamed protein product [Rhizophagus irregularis]|nr:unnamed protein product [Rhizophagus irregularis]
MISTIKELIFDLAGDFPSDNTTNLSYEDNEEVNTFPIETNDEEVISDFTNKKISIKEPLNTTGVLNKVQNNIYNALIFYWNIPNELGLMAALLDPRYKNLDFVEDEDERQQIIQKLRDEYNKINNETANSQEEIQLEPVSPEEGSSRSYKKYQQLRLMKYKNKQQVLNDESTAKVDKIAEYLAMPLAMETEDPLECGEREKPIPNTNDKFVALYEKCWRQEPVERPDIHKVNSELNKIINFTDLKANMTLQNFL